MNKTTMVAASALATALVFAPAGVRAQHEGHDHSQHGGGSQHGAAHGAGGHSMKMGTRGMQALQRLSGRQFDVAFLSQMTEHHQGAVDMSRQALPSLKNARVRRHAQNIIADQRKEIAEMRAILQREYKTGPSPAQRNLMKQDMHAMMAMKMTGDRMFLEMMIPHHQGANDMSRLALQKSKNPRIRALAQRIIKAQTAEIKDFQSLLRSRDLAAGRVPAPQRANITIDHGYEPAKVTVMAGRPVRLTFFRKENPGCGDEVHFPGLGITRRLKTGEKTVIAFTPKKSGTLRFTCGMDMYDGQVVVVR